MPAAAKKDPADLTVDPDPMVGVFVGFGATAHGTETGQYTVDPDTGCITGPAGAAVAER